MRYIFVAMNACSFSGNLCGELQGDHLGSPQRSWCLPCLPPNKKYEKQRKLLHLTWVIKLPMLGESNNMNV